jgi:hypothetical protein
MTRTLHHSMQGKPALSGVNYLITVRSVIAENYLSLVFLNAIVLTGYSSTVKSYRSRNGMKRDACGERSELPS